MTSGHNLGDRLHGWNALIERLGYEPNFHDAEIVELTLRTTGEPSSLSIFVPSFGKSYRGTEGLNVAFQLRRIRSIRIEEWAERNFAYGIKISDGGDVLNIEISPSAGAAGTIAAEEIDVVVGIDGPKGLVR